jgi:hypothetical protein
MKQQTKLSTDQQSRSVETGQQTQKPSALEFANAEEVLRYDAANTTVPPEIARRLRKSTADLPPPKMSWWKRWFGGCQP